MERVLESHRLCEYVGTLDTSRIGYWKRPRYRERQSYRALLASRGVSTHGNTIENSRHVRCVRMGETERGSRGRWSVFWREPTQTALECVFTIHSPNRRLETCRTSSETRYCGGQASCNIYVVGGEVRDAVSHKVSRSVKFRWFLRRCRVETRERVLESHGQRESLELSKVKIGLETAENWTGHGRDTSQKHRESIPRSETPSRTRSRAAPEESRRVLKSDWCLALDCQECFGQPHTTCESLDPHGSSKSGT